MLSLQVEEAFTFPDRVVPQIVTDQLFPGHSKWSFAWDELTQITILDLSDTTKSTGRGCDPRGRKKDQKDSKPRKRRGAPKPESKAKKAKTEAEKREHRSRELVASFLFAN